MNNKGKYLGKFICIKSYKPFPTNTIGVGIIENNYYHLYLNERKDFKRNFFNFDVISIYDNHDKKWLFSIGSFKLINKHLISIEKERKNKINSIFKDN